MYAKNYADEYVLFGCGWVIVDFARTLQGYFTGIVAITRLSQWQWSYPVH